MSSVIDRYKEALITRVSRSVDELVSSNAITDFSDGALDATVSSALAGVREANRINTQVGAFYSIDRVRAVLGEVSRQAVNDRVKNHRLLRVLTSDRVFLFPAFQFGEGGELRYGLGDLLRVLLASGEDGWTIVYWLTSPIEDLGGRTALEILDSREADAIVDLRALASADVAAWDNVGRGEI